VTAQSEQPSEELQLALLVSNASDYAIFMLNPDGHVVTWNTGAERISGYARDEIIGQHFSVLHTEEDLARDHPAEELRLAGRDGRYHEEGWRVRKDGSRFWADVVITPIHDEAGHLIGYGKVSRDLTDRRLAAEQMRSRTAQLEAANASLSEFERLVASVRDYAIFMLDPGGRIRSWNAGARYLKGYEADEVIGRSFSLFYTDADRARDHPGEELVIATRDGRYEEEGWRVRKDGSMFWASVTITAIHGDDGRLSGFAKVTRDLTARKAADDALQEAVEELRVANEELDRFAAVAAHDLMDPLRTISGFAEILARADLPPDASEYVGHIHASSRRLTGMLQGLLLYARAGKADAAQEPVRIADAAQEVISDLAASVAERGATVDVTIPARATVAANARDVRLILQNLLANALKFSDPADPRVVLAADPTPEGGWRTTVRDNGAGIGEADQRRIFGPFERAHTGEQRAGYGLGLAICHRLVERHHGRIGVESAPPDGSVFWFSLPGQASSPGRGAASPEG
jgi:PAS domain S-box-containing protein